MDVAALTIRKRVPWHVLLGSFFCAAFAGFHRCLLGIAHFGSFRWWVILFLLGVSSLVIAFAHTKIGCLGFLAVVATVTSGHDGSCRLSLSAISLRLWFCCVYGLCRMRRCASWRGLVLCYDLSSLNVLSRTALSESPFVLPVSSTTPPSFSLSHFSSSSFADVALLHLYLRL